MSTTSIYKQTRPDILPQPRLLTDGCLLAPSQVRSLRDGFDGRQGQGTRCNDGGRAGDPEGTFRTRPFHLVLARWGVVRFRF